MRTAGIERKTKETDIKLSLNLDGNGKFENESGNDFLTHMLDLLACHSGFDMNIYCKGDIEVDMHHSTEDIGIVFGQAVREALGDRVGITRYGNFLMPMDESLMLVAIDISGRAALNFDVTFPDAQIGVFDCALVEEFFAAVSRTLGAALHFKLLAGKNSHHIAEAAFKGFARALKQAVTVSGTAIPSSKGLLD